MNYLAHAYLSFGDPDILTGNLIADFVKGRQIESFREEIQLGIRLHRQIDDYTDHHPVVREAKAVFKETAGRYSASFLDVAFDHFLSLDKISEPVEGWKSFAQGSYVNIQSRLVELPETFTRLFGYMKEENWLYNYRYRWLMKKSFDRLTERAAYLEDNINVYSDFETHYSHIKTAYEQFFPDLRKYIEEVYPKDIL